MIVRASCTGALDLRDADLSDIRWWQRLRWTVHELLRENNLEMLKAAQLYRNAAWLKANSDDSEYAQVEDLAHVALLSVLHNRAPWEQTVPAKQDVITEAVTDWRGEYGDPSSPETQAMLAQSLEYLRKLDERAKQDADIGNGF